MTPLALHASGCDELLETKADQHADRTAQGKDGETNVHSRVAATSYHVGLQGKASKPTCLQPPDKSEGSATWRTALFADANVTISCYRQLTAVETGACIHC